MRLIDADALYEELSISDMDIYCKEVIMLAPTVEAKPVVHGYDKWKEHKEHCEFWCSECGYWLREIFAGNEMSETFKYCPNCGADMRKEA